MSKKNNLQKLELTWIGKGEEPKLEPRILIENPEFSYGDQSCENMLVHGDNLLALKALEQDYAGKVKCIYIDPPYNTGSAFEQYDDGIEHSQWLNLMRPRLKLLRNLLRSDGSIWISIDDNECHYLKVLCDEVFGRSCFIANIIWKKRDGPPNDRNIGAIHEHILIYGKVKIEKSKKTFAEEHFNLSPRTDKANKQYSVYKEPNGPDPNGPFRKIDTTANAKGGRHVESLVYAITNPYTGEKVFPRKGTCWRHNKQDMAKLQTENRLYWGVDGKATTPMRKLYLSEVRQGMTTPTIWYEVALNQHASSEIEKIFGSKAAFETPKPENLLKLIIHIASNEGEIVLDSFLGSGTSIAVAHKMGRKYIGIELGDHAFTHCFPRLKKVIDGEQGGISKAVNWQGGGGIKFYTLAPSLLKQDKFGNWIISQEYNADMLAAAMAKQEGFKYLPHESTYWKQGQSSEHDFIFTTTQFLTVEALDSIQDEMQPGETLLICCKSFQTACKGKYTNITIKKIPLMLLGRCEFGKEDYSLNIINLPMDDGKDDMDDRTEELSVQAIRVKNKPNQQTSLF